jgi:hypothetical protein
VSVSENIHRPAEPGRLREILSSGGATKCAVETAC